MFTHKRDNYNYKYGNRDTGNRYVYIVMLIQILLALIDHILKNPMNTDGLSQFAIIITCIVLVVLVVRLLTNKKKI